MQPSYLESNEQNVSKILYRIFLVAAFLMLGNNVLQFALYGLPELRVINVLYYSLFALFFIPVLFYRFSQNLSYFKSVSTITLLLFAFILHTDSWVNVPFVWLIPIGIGALYADYSLIKRTFFLSIPLLVLAQFMHLWFADTMVIESSMYRSVITSVYYGLQFVFIGFLFVNSTKRSNEMLHQSIALTDEVKHILGTVESASSELGNNVYQLNHNISDSTLSIQQVDTSIQHIHLDSQEFMTTVEKTDEYVEKMIQLLKQTATKAQDIQIYTDRVVAVADDSKQSLTDSIEKIKEVKQSSSTSKQTVLNLDEKVNEIHQVLASIYQIAEQTNLLALNAAIEAARAGEHGKGFAVVADEVRKLAEQSSQASTVIQDLLKEVVESKDEVLETLDTTDQIIDRNVASIGFTTERFEELVGLQQEMNALLNAVSSSIHIMAEESGQITTAMTVLKDKHQNNDNSITEIASAVEQVSATFQEIAATIEDISKKAIHLNQLQQGK